APPEDRLCRHLVVGITGAIGAASVAPLIFSLAREFCREIDIILTEAALSFLNPAPFEHYGLRTWTKPSERRAEITGPHIHPAAPEMVLVLPASARTIHKLAQGECSDLLSLVVAATRAPVVLAPAMNEAMWQSPAIARNVAQLRADGVYLIEPGLAY